MIALGTYMKTYKVGDIVDIKANGAVQKGVRIAPLHLNFHLYSSQIRKSRTN